MAGKVHLETAMSRKDELLKLAQLFHSQARLTLDRAAKQTLRKLGDHYQHEPKNCKDSRRPIVTQKAQAVSVAPLALRKQLYLPSPARCSL